MGLFGSIGKAFFGSKGGYGSGYRDRGNGIFDRYNAALDSAFGPQAFQARMADYTEGLDSALADQGAGGYGNLLSRGFNPSGGADLYGLTRATNLARQRADVRQDMREGQLRGLSGLFNIWQGLGPANYRQPTQGVFGQLAQAAGQYFGQQAGLPGGGGSAMVYGTGGLPYQTDPWQGRGGY